GAFLVVQAQVGLALGLVRAVAGEAELGQDGPDVAVELDGLADGAGHGQGEQEDGERQGGIHGGSGTGHGGPAASGGRGGGGWAACDGVGGWNPRYRLPRRTSRGESLPAEDNDSK